MGTDRQTVAKVIRRDSVALIRFVPHISEGERGVGCRDTNRVDRVDADGTVVYRRRCKRWVKSRVVMDKNPVIVPLEDAAHIRRGDYVVYAFLGTIDDRLSKKKRTRVGRVLGVKTDASNASRLVQLGRFRL